MKKLLTIAVLSATLVLSSVPVFAKKGGLVVNPVVGVGSVLYYPGYGDCAADTANLVVRIGSGFPNTAYTVQSGAASVGFVTDSNGTGAVGVDVSTPSYGPESVNVTVSAAGVSRTNAVYFDCVVVNPNL